MKGNNKFISTFANVFNRLFRFTNGRLFDYMSRLYYNVPKEYFQNQRKFTSFCRNIIGERMS